MKNNLVIIPFLFICFSFDWKDQKEPRNPVDAPCKLIQITSTVGMGGVTTFTYNDKGELIEVYQNSSQNKEVFEYNADGTLAKRSVCMYAGGGEFICAGDDINYDLFTWDLAGKTFTKKSKDGKETKYYIDTKKRVIKVEKDNKINAEYTYDEAGHVVQEGLEYDDKVNPYDFPAYKNAYPDGGFMGDIISLSPNNVLRSGDTVYQYEYNSQNYPSSVKSGSSFAAGEMGTFEYQLDCK